MPSKAVHEVIERFREHRRRFEALCRSLSEEELSRPVPGSSWNVRGFVSHLAAFDTELVRWFDAVHAGRLDEATRDAEGGPFDIDSWNNERVAERESWPLEEVLAEAGRNRERMLTALGKLEDGDIERIVRFAGDNKREPADIQFKLFLQGLARHDPIHAADMLKALPEREDDPQLQAWLDDPVVSWYQATMDGPPRGSPALDA